MKKHLIVYMIISIIAVAAALPVFSQETAPASGGEKKEPAPAAAPVAPAASQAKEMAIYGEVQAVNAVANTLSVQYYDYDSDSEKTVEVTVGTDAEMENAKTVSDVKKGDWVDVTYIMSGGKNAAKTVVVEKEEPATEPVVDQAATGASSDE